MKHYKVVAWFRGELYSWSLVSYAYCIEEGIILTYKVGEVTRPVIGKLFAFSDLDSAKAFAGDSVSQIYECEIENPTPGDRCAHYIRDLKDFWEGDVVGKSAPSGTVFCDSIKLLERVA